MSCKRVVQATSDEKPDIKIFTYRVAMTCEGCSTSVQRVLAKYKEMGIENIEIDLESQIVKVTVNGSLAAFDILQLIRKTGKSVEYIRP